MSLQLHSQLYCVCWCYCLQLALYTSHHITITYSSIIVTLRHSVLSTAINLEKLHWEVLNLVFPIWVNQLGVCVFNLVLVA
jgi:hypothetical protein